MPGGVPHYSLFASLFTRPSQVGLSPSLQALQKQVLLASPSIEPIPPISADDAKVEGRFEAAASLSCLEHVVVDRFRTHELLKTVERLALEQGFTPGQFAGLSADYLGRCREASEQAMSAGADTADFTKLQRDRARQALSLHGERVFGAVLREASQYPDEVAASLLMKRQEAYGRLSGLEKLGALHATLLWLEVVTSAHGQWMINPFRERYGADDAAKSALAYWRNFRDEVRGVRARFEQDVVRRMREPGDVEAFARGAACMANAHAVSMRQLERTLYLVGLHEHALRQEVRGKGCSPRKHADSAPDMAHL